MPGSSVPCVDAVGKVSTRTATLVRPCIAAKCRRLTESACLFHRLARARAGAGEEEGSQNSLNWMKTWGKNAHAGSGERDVEGRVCPAMQEPSKTSRRGFVRDKHNVENYEDANSPYFAGCSRYFDRRIGCLHVTKMCLSHRVKDHSPKTVSPWRRRHWYYCRLIQRGQFEVVGLCQPGLCCFNCKKPLEDSRRSKQGNPE